jgi:hypothetical protein
MVAIFGQRGDAPVPQLMSLMILPPKQHYSPAQSSDARLSASPKFVRVLGPA